MIKRVGTAERFGTLRFFAPAVFDSFAPAYGVTILAEGAFCLILLLGWTGQRRIRTA